MVLLRSLRLADVGVGLRKRRAQIGSLAVQSVEMKLHGIAVTRRYTRAAPAPSVAKLRRTGGATARDRWWRPIDEMPKLLLQPQDQNAGPAIHHAMDCRDWAFLHNPGEERPVSMGCQIVPPRRIVSLEASSRNSLHETIPLGISLSPFGDSVCMRRRCGVVEVANSAATKWTDH